MTGTYMGKIKKLQGHTAMLQPQPRECVKAQFDTVEGRRAGQIKDCPVGVEKFLFGWKLFDKKDFKIDG